MNTHYERVTEGQWAYCGEANGDAVIFRKGSSADPYIPGREDRLRDWGAGKGEDPDTGAAVIASEWVSVDTDALEAILDAANEKEASNDNMED